MISVVGIWNGLNLPYDQSLSPVFYEKTISFFEELIQWLHPFMPFVTEEIYHQLRDRVEGDDLCIKQYNYNELIINKEILSAGELAKNGISTIRELRSKLNLKSNVIIDLKIKTNNSEKYKVIEPIISKMATSGSTEYVDKIVPHIIGAMSGSSADMIFISGTTSTSTTTTTTKNILQEQRMKLEKELIYYKEFLDSLNKKLSNERFVQNAKPDVVDLERKKRKDTEEKIAAILLTLNT